MDMTFSAKTLAIQEHICNESEVHYDIFRHQDNSASCQIDCIGKGFKYQSQSLSLPHTHSHTRTKLLHAQSVSDRDDYFSAAGIILKQSGVRSTEFFKCHSRQQDISRLAVLKLCAESCPNSFFETEKTKKKSERAIQRGSARVNRAKLTSSFPMLITSFFF